MKFIVFVKGDRHTEAGVMPTEAQLTEMTRFNEELVASGALLSGEGLHPTASGAKIRFTGEEVTVERGPFASDDIVAGFWIIQAASLEEAIGLMKRCPNPTVERGEIEIRPLFDAADFGEAFTPELQEAEARMREQLAS
jgi:hypothetical protein